MTILERAIEAYEDKLITTGELLIITALQEIIDKLKQ